MKKRHSPVAASANKKIKYGILVVLGLFFLSLAFGSGIYVGRTWPRGDETPKVSNKKSQAQATTTDQYGQVKNSDKIPEYLGKNVNAKMLLEVWDILHNKYVEPIEDIKLFYGALSGSVAATGDPYTMFLEPKVADEFTNELKGKFEGIGAEIEIKKERLTIVTPLPDSPAEKAGIRAGDKVYMIDDFDTTGIRIDEALKRIRGPKGTKVVLTVMRENDGKEPIKIEVVRDEIRFKSVRGEMKPNQVAYIKISSFNEDTAQTFSDVLDELLDQKPTSIILDLRGNPGGYLNRAVDIASYWVDNNVIVSEQFGKNYPDILTIDKKRSHKSTKTAILKGIKTVVLINQGSASGSEIVAGALQDYKLATLIGKRTFGKGSVQELEELDDGSSVKVTIAKWLTPNGRSINDEGITPDIEVDLSDEDYNNDRDPQLDKAMEVLGK